MGQGISVVAGNLRVPVRGGRQMDQRSAGGEVHAESLWRSQLGVGGRAEQHQVWNDLPAGRPLAQTSWREETIMIGNYLVVALVFGIAVSYVTIIHHFWLRHASKEDAPLNVPAKRE